MAGFAFALGNQGLQCILTKWQRVHDSNGALT